MSIRKSTRIPRIPVQYTLTAKARVLMVIPVSSQKGKSQNKSQIWEEAMAGPDAPKWQEVAKLELTVYAENGT